VEGIRSFYWFFDCSFYCDQFRNIEQLDKSNICSNISCDKLNELIAEVNAFKSVSSGRKESTEYKSMIALRAIFICLRQINDFLLGNNYCYCFTYSNNSSAINDEIIIAIVLRIQTTVAQSMMK
jgi:hypothetical protein